MALTETIYMVPKLSFQIEYSAVVCVIFENCYAASPSSVHVYVCEWGEGEANCSALFGKIEKCY